MPDQPRTPDDDVVETRTTVTTPAPQTSGVNLSWSQVAGGSLAAATAALLGSRLGTTGTIVGAALVSVITAVGSALYTASLRRTREVVVRTREILPTGQWRTIALPRVQDQPDGTEADVTEVDDEGPQDAELEDRASLWSRISWKPVALVTGVVFAIAALLVTGAELATGHDTTVVKVVHGGDKSDTTPSPTPSKSPSKTPSSSTTSATPTPSDSASAVPTESASPTDVPSATPTPSDSASAVPTESPSATP
ncbi:MAG: hypothetical protein JWO46_568 [Nocardioidaceae bacterium]|nr:hypothetical protein [Nocardioidaceae bacterium]